VVELLPGKHKILSSNPSTTKKKKKKMALEFKSLICNSKDRRGEGKKISQFINPKHFPGI
jgi:hypothetical protein